MVVTEWKNTEIWRLSNFENSNMFAKVSRGIFHLIYIKATIFTSLHRI